VTEAARTAFVSGLNDILWIGVGIAAGGALLALALVRGADFVASRAPDQAGPGEQPRRASRARAG
jgi:hypothetical protein